MLKNLIWKVMELFEDENYMTILNGQKKCVEVIEFLHRDIGRVRDATRHSELDFQPGNRSGGWTNPDYLITKIVDFEIPEEWEEDYNRLGNLIGQTYEAFNFVEKERLAAISRLKREEEEKVYDKKLSFEDLVSIVHGKHQRFKLEHLVTLDENPRSMHIEYTFGITFSDEGKSYKCKCIVDHHFNDEYVDDALSDEIGRASCRERV